MKSIPILLLSILLVPACTDNPAGPFLEPEPAFDSRPVSMEGPGESMAVTESVRGSGHLVSPRNDAYRTFSLHAIRAATGELKGQFHWRVHLGRDGSKVSGSIACLSIEGNQAWLAGIFEKAVNPDNIGKWASFWVVDNGEGSGDPPDQMSLRWEGVITEESNPEDFCESMPTDGELLPVENGNIQVR